MEYNIRFCESRLPDVVRDMSSSNFMKLRAMTTLRRYARLAMFFKNHPKVFKEVVSLSFNHDFKLDRDRDTNEELGEDNFSQKGRRMYWKKPVRRKNVLGPSQLAENGLLTATRTVECTYPSTLRLHT